MNNADLQHAILKVLGLTLLLLATLSAARTIGAFGSAWYWAATQPSIPVTSGFTLGRQFMSTAIGHIPQMLMLGWLGVQVLREKPWILILTRMDGRSVSPADASTNQ